MTSPHFQSYNVDPQSPSSLIELPPLKAGTKYSRIPSSHDEAAFGETPNAREDALGGLGGLREQRCVSPVADRLTLRSLTRRKQQKQSLQTGRSSHQIRQMEVCSYQFPLCRTGDIPQPLPRLADSGHHSRHRDGDCPPHQHRLCRGMHGQVRSPRWSWNPLYGRLRSRQTLGHGASLADQPPRNGRTRSQQLYDAVSELADPE